MQESNWTFAGNCLLSIINLFIFVHIKLINISNAFIDDDDDSKQEENWGRLR